ncbi:MAG: hypothetical protein JO129_00410 [Candidatus Dependentiae bacterium]|nr:hypothetical protein [Candidatus Dependentiae bacterium]
MKKINQNKLISIILCSLFINISMQAEELPEYSSDPLLEEHPGAILNSPEDLKTTSMQLPEFDFNLTPELQEHPELEEHPGAIFASMENLKTISHQLPEYNFEHDEHPGTIFVPAHKAKRDILLEFSAAVFVPSNETFKSIYNNCPEFSIELTGLMFNQLYAFTSVDFLRKDGVTPNFASPTQVNIVNLALGAKYFFNFSHVDLYFGIGIAPTYLCTIDQIPETFKQSQWSCGGIAKSGLIVNLPHAMFLDFFFDYSFVKSSSYSSSPTILQNTILNGCVLGIGFGYRFH